MPTSTPRRKLGIVSSPRSSSGLPPRAVTRPSNHRKAAASERHRGQHDERPRGPALLTALGQRQHQAGQRQRHQHRTADVEPAATAGAGLRHHQPGGQHHRDADRQLGEEHGAPAEVERAPFDQRAAGELADRGGKSHHHAVEAERLGEFCLAREQRSDRAEHLRHQHGGGDALQDAADHELRRRVGEAAQRVGGDEAGHADQEQPAAAVQVAEPSAGDQEHGVAGGIAGDDKLQFGRVGAERGVDGGQADVDDEEVDRRQQAAGEHHDEREPTTCVGQGNGRRYGWHGAFLSGGNDGVLSNRRAGVSQGAGGQGWLDDATIRLDTMRRSEVDPAATPEAIAAAYRRKARVLHPDVPGPATPRRSCG